ncbi:MAG: hypothetical protein HOO86_13105 [Bacteroidales bacterium]|nr:hypothetical protein [Bacteroidales bacterium]
MKRKIVFVSILSVFMTVHAFAQSKNRAGLSGSVQGNQFGISIPVWLSEKFVLAPVFDFKYAEKVGSDFSIGLAPRFYLRKEKLAPYFGLKLGTMINTPSKSSIYSDTKIDYVGGIAFGAEYFITEIFSVGVEAQGNFTKSDKYSQRYGNPGGVNFNTATAVSATIYFSRASD